MSTPLTIVAIIEAQPEKIELVKSELLKLVEPTLNEAGCIQYDFHQDNQNPAIFLAYENWENRELWQNHMQSAHLAAFGKATEGAVVGATVHEMTRI